MHRCYCHVGHTDCIHYKIMIRRDTGQKVGCCKIKMEKSEKMKIDIQNIIEISKRTNRGRK